MGTNGRYIMADFFLHWPEVIIEVDGPEHSKSRDYARDAQVKELFAYETIRISNQEISSNSSSTLKTREKLVRLLAEAEGLNKKQVAQRLKDYLRRQKAEGML
jgi:very-short-patch-repair endonuclease